MDGKRDMMEGGRRKTKLWAGLGIALAVSAALILGALKSGIFLGAGERILLAAVNTVSYKSPLAEDVGILAVLFSDGYTADMELKAQGVTVEAQYRCGLSEKQLAGSVELGFLLLDL